jgi:hypothetical protein
MKFPIATRRAFIFPTLMGITIASSHAATLAPVITEGDVIGTTYLFDGNASTGGGDFNSTNANFIRTWSPLNVGLGGTQVTITGLALGLPLAGNTDNNSMTATITYYGANGVAGGGDDVSFGTTTATLDLGAAAARYEWLFDTPLVQTIDGANSVFVVNLTGTSSFRLKTTTGTTAANVKIDIAGSSLAVIPEPSASLLAGLGFIGLLRRRR